MMVNKIVNSIQLFLIILWVIPVSAQNVAIHSKDSLPIDLSIHYGRLDNGFTYYIKHLKDAQNVEMNLWVKAGQFNQTEKQSIAAHLIEHLPFRSTKDFPGTNIKLNPTIKKHHLNNFAGQTLLIHTSYKLYAPISSGLEGLSAGLWWFQNIGNMNLADYDIKKEAGILRQEALFRSGDFIEWNLSNSKRKSQIFPCSPDISNFFDDVENISLFEVESFYKKWYRSDRMGLVVIGNIRNIAALEEQIKTIFSKLRLRDSPNPKCDCVEEYLNSKGKFVLVKKNPSGWIKEENPPVEVFLNFRKKDPILRDAYSKEALKHSLIWNAIAKLIAYRSNAYNMNSILINQRDRERPFLQISFEERSGLEKEKIKNIVRLLAQINKFGFTSKEWESIQNGMLQTQTNRTDTNSTSYWNTQMQNHFLYHETLPENKLGVIKRLLQSISIEDLNRYITENFRADPDDISMLIPSDNRALAYTEPEVRDWIYQTLEEPITPFKVPTQKNQQIKNAADAPWMAQSVMDSLPLIGISNMEIDQNTGLEVVMLDNGIRVVLDKNGSSKNQTGNIEIHGFTPKGAKCFPDSDYFSAINAPDLIQNKEDSQKVKVYIDNFTSGIKVRGNVDNIEQVFQRIYQNFQSTAPTTKKNYALWKISAERQYFYPNRVLHILDFQEYKQTFLGDKTVIPHATKRFYGIKETSYKKAYTFYRKLLGNASDYTFIISGDYNNDQITPLLQKYLGNLPVQQSKLLSNCANNDKLGESALPSAPVYKEFYAEDLRPAYSLKDVGYELAYIVQHKEDFLDWRQRTKLVALGKFIQPRLENLRYEKKAGLYGIHYSNIKFNKSLQTFKIAIHVACHEEELEWLKQECQSIINDIKTKGLDQKEFAEVIKDHMLPYFVAKPNQKPTSSEIFEYFRYGTPIVNKQEREAFVRSLTPEAIQETAREYFTRGNKYEFVMRNSREEKKSH